MCTKGTFKDFFKKNEINLGRITDARRGDKLVSKHVIRNKNVFINDNKNV